MQIRFIADVGRDLMLPKLFFIRIWGMRANCVCSKKKPKKKTILECHVPLNLKQQLQLSLKVQGNL